MKKIAFEQNAEFKGVCTLVITRLPNSYIVIKQN